MKQNSGCGILGIILCVVGGIVLASDGNFQYLIYLILFISIPLLLIYLMRFFSSDLNKDQQSEEKLYEAVKEAQKAPEGKSYRINKNELTGAIKSSNLPAEIRNLQNLETIRLNTDHPIEISSLINQNQNLKYLSLSGQFWLKDKVTPEILNLSLNYIENISETLDRFINRQKIEVLTIKSSKIDIEDVYHFSRNVKTLTLRSELQEFPYELMNLPYLKVLDLSNNKISRISDKKLQRTKMQESNLQVLNLSTNYLKTVPLSCFHISSLKFINLNNNPLKKRVLRELQRNYSGKVLLSYDQKKIASRTLHPQTWLTLKILLSLILVLFPMVVFGSFLGSVLIGIFVWSAWSV